MEKTKALAINYTELAQKLDENVLSVIGSETIKGFEKAFMISSAIGRLKELITSEYMKPIMELQGNRLGFKTDKDKDGGYPEAVVKNCLIEAVLMGVQPAGNQFNIIAGNTYITKEGFGYLLKGVKGLKYDISFELPRINTDKSSAAIVAKIHWEMNNEKNDKSIELPIKMNAYMGTDAVIGKATRKARAWLFNTINGTEFGDGDITDHDATVVETKTIEIVSKEDLELLFEMKKPSMDAKEITEAERIIKYEEKNSYSKLHKKLKAL